jgi:hypothetical protein
MLNFAEFLLESELNDQEARDILGLPISYSPEQLKSAYYKASKLNHPDLNKNADPNKIRQINAAYAKLKNKAPDNVVTPSTVDSEIVSRSNNADLAFKKERERRRAELLSKNKKAL